MKHPTEPTYIELNTSRLERNHAAFSVDGLAVAPVVKANAYGHGSVGTAKALLSTDLVPFLITATYREARKLRTAGITAEILVIGHVKPATINRFDLDDVVPTALTLSHLKALAAELSEPRKLHLKVDTGMHRYGIRPGELSDALDLINNSKKLTLAGVFSHLSDDFGEFNDFTRRQIMRFHDVSEMVKSQAPTCEYFHLGSTASFDFRDKISANLQRIGFGLYGIGNFTDSFETEPVLTLVSEIVSLRTITAGEEVGYERTYRAAGKRVIATIPAGYFEGVDRRLSNKGVVRIAGKEVPIVGKVSMNATTVDVSEIASDISVGDRVELISADRNAGNSAEAIAELIDAPTYRPTTQLPSELERRYI